MMFLKFRHRLRYESLCREVSDSICRQRFARIPLGTRVPHPTTLMKITTRCGDAAVAGLNEALLTKAAEAKLLPTDKVPADITVVEADVAYPTDSGLLAKHSARWRASSSGSGPPAAPPTPGHESRGDLLDCGPARSPASCGCVPKRARTRHRPPCGGSPATSPGSPNGPCVMRRCCGANAKRALRLPGGQRKGRLRRAINDLQTIVNRAERVAAQTRRRLAGVMPESASRLVSLDDVDGRPIRKGRLG